MLAQLAPMLVSLMGQDVGASLRRARRGALLYAAATVLVLTAYGAVVAGIIIAMTREHGPVAAMVVLALLAIVMALGVIAAILALNRRDRTRESSSSNKALMTMAAVTVLPAVLRSRALTSVATLAGLAFLLMRSGSSPTNGDA